MLTCLHEKFWLRLKVMGTQSREFQLKVREMAHHEWTKLLEGLEGEGSVSCIIPMGMQMRNKPL